MSTTGRSIPVPILPWTFRPTRNWGRSSATGTYGCAISTGAETQLTSDGVKDYGYATDNAGWKATDGAILLWSPDSTKIATFQQDQRKTGEMYLVPTTNTHPDLKAWKYPLVGDQNVTMIERMLFGTNTLDEMMVGFFDVAVPAGMDKWKFFDRGQSRIPPKPD